MNDEALAHFRTLVHAGYSVRVIRDLMKYKGHDLSDFEDSDLVCKMRKILESTKEDIDG